ncbi:hypothetical protein JMJ77_0009049, partial [Colletotrichum scovillei]
KAYIKVDLRSVGNRRLVAFENLDRSLTGKSIIKSRVYCQETRQLQY